MLEIKRSLVSTVTRL